MRTQINCNECAWACLTYEGNGDVSVDKEGDDIYECHYNPPGLGPYGTAWPLVTVKDFCSEAKQ
jgi:hypothetical protein